MDNNEKRLKKVEAEDVGPKREDPRDYFRRIAEMNQQLLDNIKANMVELEALLDQVNWDSMYGDMVYRFYHHSFKVYWVQSLTHKIVDLLWKCAPEGCEMNGMFKKILEDGTGKKFQSEHSSEWLKHTRPQLEAFFHAKYFLEMAVKFGNELEKAPECLPFGWAGLLYFYNLR